jgi:hypothetical protein
MKLKVFGNDKNYDKFTTNQIRMIEISKELDRSYRI